MTIWNQILYVQSFSAAFSLLGLVTAGQFMPALSFVSRHPQVSLWGCRGSVSQAPTVEIWRRPVALHRVHGRAGCLR